MTDAALSPNHKWMVLSNTTVGMLTAVVNASIVLISLPAIFRGIHLDPLDPGNTNTLLWTIMGYMVVTSVLVVTFGRLADMYGRSLVYNLGFAIFTVGSILLSVMPTNGFAPAYLVWMRILQGVGGAMITSTATAILVDAFPPHQRGLALGINTMAAIGGQFIGLILGGLFADINWRLIFWINVPLGIIGTLWGFYSLKDTNAPRKHGRIDWWGNLLFAVGLILVLVAVNDGIQPTPTALMAWGTPRVLGELIVGLAFLVAFVFFERRVRLPMFDFNLFRVRPFAAGVAASLSSAIGRGGLQFMLIIWLQGIWLPLHGYDYTSTPLWAGIYMLPLTFGFLVAGPTSGTLSDRFGQRVFASTGLLVAVATFLGLMALPVNFSYPAFAALLFLNGVGQGMFSAPNTSAIMSSVPPEQRGVASGMRSTFQNSGNALSIGVFFSLMISGLAGSLPHTLSSGLQAQGVPADTAAGVAGLPPVSTLFATFLGENPIGHLLAPTGVLNTLHTSQVGVLTGTRFFPELVSGPFHQSLVTVFTAAAVMAAISAVCSLLRGKRRQL